MSNYSATVVRIENLRPIPKADRLLVTTIFGNSVIVGIETKVGDLGLFFPLESQIGLEFAQANDLIRRTDENGKPAGGMFDANRRVRAQTFRGQKSMGFFMPLESLNHLGTYVGKVLPILNLEVGEEIDTIEFGSDKYNISQKYVPKRNVSDRHLMKGAKQPRESRIIPDQFRFHFDTAQLGKNIHRLSPTDVVAITWKLHGTSAIAARVLVKCSLSWLEKLFQFFVKIDNTIYDYIYASRRVVKNEFQEVKDHYYGHDLWSEVGQEHFGGKLHSGETVYYEIVGYTKDGSPIQKGFDYGCSPDGIVNPQHKVFVYRITQTAVDGSVVELQWNQVKERCLELGVANVPELYYDQADLFAGYEYAHMPVPGDFTIEKWQEEYLAYLRMKYVYDQDSIFCENKVPEEGICVRKEGLNIEVFKLKSFRFLEFETKALDKGEVDMEMEQSEIADGTSI